nr:translation initiation factor IF-3 [Chitinivibrio alkaliphilus]
MNDMIRVPKVRAVDSKGDAIGIIPVEEARALAREAGMDLVEVAPKAKPPVCRIMDYGKYKYEQSKKKKSSNKKQTKVQNKEIKLHVKTEEHDYNFKLKHAREFILKGNRVKMTLVFRGREIMYKDMAREMMERVDRDLSDIATTERKCVLEGRNMQSQYIPDKAKIKEYLKHTDETE